MFFKKNKSCKRCAELAAKVTELNRALGAKDKLHRKELVFLTAEIDALRLMNEKLIKERCKCNHEGSNCNCGS